MKRNVHFLLILSVILLYYGISGLSREFGRFSDYMIETEGRIVGLHEKAPSKGAAVHPIVVFKDTSGNEITFTSKTGSPFYRSRVGKTVRVQYPEGFPDNAAIKASAYSGLSPVFLLLSGTALFILWFGDAYKSSFKGDGLPRKKP